MRIRFSILFLFISSFCFAQIKIRGKVYEVNGVMQGAAVYLNNTMLGTTTNVNGEFTLPIKDGVYQLIISYLGYEKIIYNLNTSTYKKPLKFVLKETSNTLNEIVIKKTIYDDEWKYNLATFKKEFIGRTKFASNCEILNPEVLHFEFDRKTMVLTAFARKPLLIKNKSLGYKITYELEEFILDRERLIYLGYARYKNLKGSRRKQRKWKENRAIAYNGSYLHFYQSLIKNTTYKDGFLVHLFKRLPNPERPSEENIKKARDFIKLNRSNISFSNRNKTPETKLDSAYLTVRKSKLPKFKDHIYKTKAPISDIISQKKKATYLDFEHHILVVYTKELEEEAYIGAFRSSQLLVYQENKLYFR